MIGTSPPGPFRCGSTTCRVNAVATPASKALPPFSSVAIPTAVAIQWVEVTTPKVPSISGRVVKGSGLMWLAMFFVFRFQHDPEKWKSVFRKDRAPKTGARLAHLITAARVCQLVYQLLPCP